MKNTYKTQLIAELTHAFGKTDLSPLPERVMTDLSTGGLVDLKMWLVPLLMEHRTERATVAPTLRLAAGRKR